MNNLVSVIMPLYNGSKTIQVSVNSLLEQTYSNWELIIVDDCSTDNSYKIAREIASVNTEKIKVFQES